MAGRKLLPLTTETNSSPKLFQRELKKEPNSPGTCKVKGVLVQRCLRLAEVLERKVLCKSAADRMFYMSVFYYLMHNL